MKTNFTQNSLKKLVKDITSRKKKQAINDCNSIVEDVDTILKSRTTKKRKKIVDTLILLRDIFVTSKTDDKTDDKTSDKTGDKTDDETNDDKTDDDK